MNPERAFSRQAGARASKPRAPGNPIAAILVMTMAAAVGIVRAESITVLQNGDISSWSERRFSGSTGYEIVTFDGRTALRASSKNSASGLFRRIRVDIEKTPILHWSWHVRAALNELDERTREGDDYRARVFVIRNRPLLFWMTSALNYVWSSSLEKGATWQNAHAHPVRMVAVRSGNTEAGRWIDERRDVRRDFRTLLGRDVRFIEGVAVMTDTDNSGGAAVAYYGDIRFASE